MAKILYVGDIGCQTGFGRVAEYLIPAFAKHHEVHGLASNWHGDPNDMQKHCKMYPAMAYGSDPFGSHRIADLVRTIQPDVIFFVNDIWVVINLYGNIEALKEDHTFKTVVYTPIDSYGLFPELLEAVNKWDVLITYTQFAKQELRKMGYEKPIEVVGHGTDFTKFFPIDKQQARKDLGVPEDVFIVFNGNRNQPRKRIDLTIKAFIDFALDKPNARLWLNMGKKDMGWDLVPLFKRVARDAGYDPTSKLILTSPNFSTHNCLPIDQLNKVYNAVDIGVNTCIGEGWGLVNTEHAAVGVAQVVPDHTSLSEIFNGVERIDCEGSETDRNYGLERMLPSPRSLVHILNDYYYAPEALAEAGQWCRNRVREDQFTWPHIERRMLSIVDKALTSHKMKATKGFADPVKVN